MAEWSRQERLQAQHDYLVAEGARIEAETLRLQEELGRLERRTALYQSEIRHLVRTGGTLDDLPAEVRIAAVDRVLAPRRGYYGG